MKYDVGARREKRNGAHPVASGKSSFNPLNTNETELVPRLTKAYF